MAASEEILQKQAKDMALWLTGMEVQTTHAEDNLFKDVSYTTSRMTLSPFYVYFRNVRMRISSIRSL